MPRGLDPELDPRIELPPESEPDPRRLVRDQEPEPFANGDFAAWTDDQPDRWDHRQNVGRRDSEFVPPERLPGGGIAIHAGHAARPSLRQTFAATGREGAPCG